MRGLLIDLDGVVWEGDTVVAGAPATVEWLAAKQIPHLFVTNTTSRPRRLIADKLARLGMPVAAGKILTPPVAACSWLAEHAPGPVKVIVPEATLEDFSPVELCTESATTQPSAVVIGDIGAAWTYQVLNDAFRLLMADSPPQLVALGMTRYWRADDGLRLDVAPFIKALEHAAGCKAAVLGKPAREFFDVALAAISCTAGETIMVGDDIVGDVSGAQQAGLRGCLVRTGKFRTQDLAGNYRPDAILDSIADLPRWWRKQSAGD